MHIWEDTKPWSMEGLKLSEDSKPLYLHFQRLSAIYILTRKNNWSYVTNIFLSISLKWTKPYLKVNSLVHFTFFLLSSNWMPLKVNLFTIKLSRSMAALNIQIKILPYNNTEHIIFMVFFVWSTQPLIFG